MKSGDYISKKDYNTKITNLKASNKDDIKTALNKARKEWKIDSMERKVAEYKKVSQTTAYKMAIYIEKLIKTLKIGGNNG